ncbi:MAG: carboxymuconolactone decarboxylase family protein [Sporichthyaceae bacterium]
MDAEARIGAWLPKSEWAGELSERHPAFAEGYARVGDVLSADGHLPAKYKLLFAAAIAAVKRDRDLVAHFAAAAAAAGVSSDEYDGTCVGLLISRGVTPHQLLTDVRGENFPATPGAGAGPADASVQGAYDYFTSYFGFVPDYVELLGERAPQALEGYFLMRDAALTGTRLDKAVMELLLCAVNAAEYQSRFVMIHARGALAAGASEEALVEACLVALPFAGVASWLPAAEGILAARKPA